MITSQKNLSDFNWNFNFKWIKKMLDISSNSDSIGNIGNDGDDKY